MKKVLSLALVFLLALAWVQIPTSYAKSEPDVIDNVLADKSIKVNSTYARGMDYSIKYVGNDTFIWRSEKPFILNSETSMYEGIIFKDKYDAEGFYQVQTGSIGIQIYDYYVKLFSPDLNEVKVYDERFVVEQYGKNKKWVDIGAQSGQVVFNIINSSDQVVISKSFISWAGVLNISYVFNVGIALKRVISFTSILDTEELFQVKMDWSGIVASKIKADSTVYTIDQPYDIDSYQFSFLNLDNSFSLYHSEQENYFDFTSFPPTRLLDKRLVSASFDYLTGNQIKGSFTYGNWSLNQNESLTIDPTTTTLSDPTEDGYIQHPDASGFYNWNAVGDDKIYFGDVSGAMYRGAVEWDISGIMDGSTISNITLEYHGSGNNDDNEIRDILQAQPSVNLGSAAERQQIWNDIANGTVYSNDVNFPVVSANQTISLINATSDLQSQLTLDWFAIGFKSVAEAGNKGTSNIYSEQYGSPDPPPTLIVEYTLPYVYITATFHTGISSMAANTTNLINATATGILNQTIVIIDSNITSGYVFFRYELPESEDNHTHYQTYTRTMTGNYSIEAFALQTGGGGVSYTGVGFIVMILCLAWIILLLLFKPK